MMAGVIETGDQEGPLSFFFRISFLLIQFGSFQMSFDKE